MLNRTVLGGDYTIDGLLDLVRDTFGGTRAELVEDVSVTSQDTAVPAYGATRLVLRGRRLDDGERRVLSAFASHLGVLREREELVRQTEAARELEAGNRTRTALLAAVSHDLRTPLTGIRSAAETLRAHDDELSSEDRAALLEALVGSTVRLTALVSDLLDMSRLQTGVVQPALSEVPLNEVVDRALKDLTGAERVRVGLLPPAVVDPGLLERVLANVLANALQHSDNAVEVSGWRMVRGSPSASPIKGRAWTQLTAPGCSTRSSASVMRPRARGLGWAWPSRADSPKRKAGASWQRMLPVADW